MNLPESLFVLRRIDSDCTATVGKLGGQSYFGLNIFRLAKRRYRQYFFLPVTFGTGQQFGLKEGDVLMIVCRGSDRQEVDRVTHEQRLESARKLLEASRRLGFSPVLTTKDFLPQMRRDLETKPIV